LRIALQGNRLKALREAKGYTQEKLAELINVASLQIYRWESGQRDPSSDTVARLARILGTTTDYLVGIEDAPQHRARKEDLSPDEQLLVEAYRAGRIWEIIRLLEARSPGQGHDGPDVAPPKPAVNG
jgi:transcriptional regulator with XRE-family HTH domain